MRARTFASRRGRQSSTIERSASSAGGRHAQRSRASARRLAPSRRADETGMAWWGGRGTPALQHAKRCIMEDVSGNGPASTNASTGPNRQCLGRQFQLWTLLGKGCMHSLQSRCGPCNQLLALQNGDGSPVNADLSECCLDFTRWQMCIGQPQFVDAKQG